MLPTLLLLVFQELIPASDPAEKPWMPDLGKAGARIEIPADRRVDVLILGDGYLREERAQFEKDVKDWYERFQTYLPWQRMKGAFRVRGVWTPGEGRATAEKRSHYRLPATTAGVGDATSVETRTAIFAAIEKAGTNRRDQRGRLTHTTVVMLVRNEQSRNPSGMTRGIQAPDGKLSVSVGFAAYTHHEFGHAYGGLRDEYMLGIGTTAASRPASPVSIFSVSNVIQAKDAAQLPWKHLAPGGALNPDKSSVVGCWWQGGGAEDGAWHAEPKCLMNGTHENWDFAKTKRGINLRDQDRFCFWCEEIVVARTFEKAGLLGESTDGEALWRKWSDEFRPLYHKAFDVPARIRAKNEEHAKARLQDSKLYTRP
jgi:hypothetical protein